MLHSAMNAAAFLDVLGVNTHLGWSGTPYANLGQVAAELDYLGIHNLRDHANSTAPVAAMMAQGFRFDLIAGGDPAGAVGAVHGLAAAYPDAVIGIEGPNEVDGAPVSYSGQSGSAGAVAYQQSLYAGAKADALLAGVPVYNLTVAGLNAAANLGNLAAYADYANVHIYFGAGMPAYGASPGNTTFAWTSWLNSGQADAPGRPTVVTETGASAAPLASGGVDESVQARQILDALMDAAKNGVAATYLYELADSSNNGPADLQSNFGLFRWDGSARPAAVAVHDLLQILGGQAPANDATGALDYDVSGVPQWGGQLLFQQANGAQDIVVWAEPQIWNGSSHSEVSPPVSPVVIDLASAANVAIYDPLQGAGALQAQAATGQVSLSVTDHPIIVQVTPWNGGGAVLSAASVLGGPGPDSISGPETGATLMGGAGDDSIAGGAGFDQINGNLGDDTIVGRSTVGDWLLGGQGNDRIDALSSTGGNQIYGNLGNDTLYGGAGPDTLRGGQGDDEIHGSGGDDWISGDLGNNTLYGGQGADTFHGGAGHDVVAGWGAGDHVQVDAGVTWTTSQVNGDVHVIFSNGGEMDLIGVQLGALPSDWIGYG